MANLLSQFSQWLKEQRAFRIAWFAKDPQRTSEAEEVLTELPSEVAEDLLEAVNNLPNQPDEVDCIVSALEEAIARWKKNPRLSNNSLVVLAHPASSISRILTDSLERIRENESDPLPVSLLDWIERPLNPDDLKPEISKKLGGDSGEAFSDLSGGDLFGGDLSGDPSRGHTAESTKDTPSQQGSQSLKATEEGEGKIKALAVVPNLCWCFLRSADGLDGVDYLQDTLLGDRTRFWVIGSGKVGWEYLRSTLKFHAYCGDTVNLPELTGQQMQDWIQPVIEQFDIHFVDATLHKRFDNPTSLLKKGYSADNPMEFVSDITQEISATVESSVDAIRDELLPKPEDEEKSSAKTNYFRRLSDISGGVSVVALQLFMQSLHYKEQSQDKPGQPSGKNGEADASEALSQEKKQLVATIPKLPPLPDLSQSDLYLLYSLMLHGDLTIQTLSSSLGDAPQVVTNQVQILRNADIIERKDGVLKINPIYYPQLRRELTRNNFIIEMNY
ncbi:MAG: helix-turn-helix domain-containing protein [Cyanobacteria bacterium J06554_11]